MRSRISPAIVAVFLVLAVAAVGGEGRDLRVISLYAAHTEVLLRLGARDNIIGVSRQESYAGPETDGWEPPVFSFRDDVEKFFAARPDVILIRPQHAASGAHMKEALERVGIAVLALQVTDASGLHAYWRELGKLVGREEEAEAMIREFDAGMERIRRESATLPRRPGVFLESVHREVKTFTPDSIPYWLVEAAGGRNAAPNAVAAYPGVIIADYGPERLLAGADEIELFISQEGAMNRTPLAAIAARDIYAPLAAFKKGRVRKIPEAVLARPTPSLLDGARMLAEWVRAAAMDSGR